MKGTETNRFGGNVLMILRFENVTKYFGGLAAVKDVSFNLESNQILGLIGPNGSGKRPALT